MFSNYGWMDIGMESVQVRKRRRESRHPNPSSRQPPIVSADPDPHSTKPTDVNVLTASNFRVRNEKHCDHDSSRKRRIDKRESEIDGQRADCYDESELEAAFNEFAAWTTTEPGIKFSDTTRTVQLRSCVYCGASLHCGKRIGEDITISPLLTAVKSASVIPMECTSCKTVVGSRALHYGCIEATKSDVYISLEVLNLLYNLRAHSKWGLATHAFVSSIVDTYRDSGPLRCFWRGTSVERPALGIPQTTLEKHIASAYGKYLQMKHRSA